MKVGDRLQMLDIRLQMEVTKINTSNFEGNILSRSNIPQITSQWNFEGVNMQGIKGANVPIIALNL